MSEQLNKAKLKAIIIALNAANEKFKILKRPFTDNPTYAIIAVGEVADVGGGMTLVNQQCVIIGEMTPELFTEAMTYMYDNGIIEVIKKRAEELEREG